MSQVLGTIAAALSNLASSRLSSRSRRRLVDDGALSALTTATRRLRFFKFANMSEARLLESGVFNLKMSKKGDCGWIGKGKGL